MLEAVDTRTSAWPPWWLGMGARIAAFLVVVLTLTQLGALLGARLLRSDIGEPIITAIRSYAFRYPISAKVPPEETLTVWAGSGVLALAFASRGNLGGRIAWSVFGVLSCAMVYVGSPSSEQWTTTGLTAMAWSTLSILAFRKVAPKQRRKIGQLTDEERLDKLDVAATRRAIRLGFPSLEDYFADRGNQKLDVIASELKIPRKQVSPLRSRYVEAEISTQSRLTPRQQREIHADIRSGKYTDAQIRERNSCELRDIRRAQKAVAKSGGESQK
jgi:hypothetical protein